ncbi:MAG: alanine racemase [Candidatus Babeliales bacterium]
MQKHKSSPASWVQIDKEALEHNIRMYKNITRHALLAPVIKSNAYGHGMELIAKICDQNPLVDMLCVVSVREALLLRREGITKPLLVISILDDGLEEAVAHDIDLVAYDLETITELNAIGQRLNKKAQIHLKFDTGLSRLGLHSDNLLALVEQIHSLPFITIRGIFTHFAESESDDQTFTNHQLTQFNTLLAELDAREIHIPLKHSACTAAITASTANHCTMVRLGIGLYGLWPSQENKQLTEQLYPNFSLKPAMTWKTRIIQIKDIPAGSYIGYDRSHQVDRPTRLAILPVGYWDGFDRRLSNKGQVLINNQLAPIRGKVAMNLCIVDITGLDVSVDHEVTLLGNHQDITADDIAGLCETINYEIVTRINPLLPRTI